jgi:dCMP deaminase
MIAKWDLRFLALAQHVATWSKDPSTKCGAVIVRPDRTIASLGYNGFPRGVSDAEETYANREEKYKRVVHSEMNAILSANELVRGFTLYNVPLPPCERCAVHIIQAGISRVVSFEPDSSTLARWGSAFELSKTLFREAGVEVVLL